MNIEKFCERYNFGKVINIAKISGGLMHKMFKVETDKGIYCVKVLNPEIMSRKEAYGNFVVSESVSNLAKQNGIPVSSALSIDGNYLTKLDNMYYMVFDYVDGKILKDDEITAEHCKKIGNVLAHIHSLDYKEIGLEPNVVEYKRLYDWESYANNPNFSRMSYRDLFLRNYKKYNSMLKRANQRLNSSNKNQTICHSDMDPKNVMWNDDNPIIIDWECAGVSNPERELLEDALCWSGFLSNNFSEEKFVAIFKEYSKYRSIDDIEWFDVICGNLVGRFGWLKYNLERSLGIISNDEEEMKLAENEVAKTIDEINRYLDLIGEMYDIIIKLTIKETENYDMVMQQIVDNNEILKGKKFKLITAGFTNTIYSIDNYIIRICTDSKNEERFENEINFYKGNKDNNGIPKLYVSDTTKSVVPYYYEVIEKVSGKTLYELWYRLSDIERRKIVIQIIDILRPFHSKEVKGYEFLEILKTKILYLKDKCNFDDELFNDLVDMCYKYFKENTFGLIHGDLHFDNFMFDGTNLYLLDFERCMVAPIDYDFRIFSKYNSQPYLWASAKTDMLAVESDYQDLMSMFLENYKELSEIPYIKERLEFYSIIESLENYKSTKNEERMQEVREKIKKLKLEENKFI
jgi:Ser/Thr protein kinase RdoA (MazF antagonist)